MNDLSIKVECLAGADIPSAIRQMLTLADRLEVTVRCKMNEVEVAARPGILPDDLIRAWRTELESERPYKFAIV